MNTSEIKRQVIVLILSLTISILLSFVPEWTGTPIKLAEKILFILGLFNVFQLLNILWTVSNSAARQAKEYELWSLREIGDRELTNIRACFAQIVRESYGEKDLFVTHFIEEFHELANKIENVAKRQELRVQADHFLHVDNVLDAFQGDHEKIWRYIWPISADGKLFDNLPWKRYFEATAGMVRQNIEQIRAIIILDDLRLTAVPRVKKLLDFFYTSEAMDCRIIKRVDYETICADNNIPANYLDFGIYGTRLLFLTEQYEPDIIGIFTKNAILIRNYKNLFDTMWNSTSITKPNPSNTTRIVTLGELFTFDDDQDAKIEDEKDLKQCAGMERSAS